MSAALTFGDFETLMDPCGPFEPAPVVAVAVSGGADSLCLALLADAWARARGGRAVALTVDHGLRAESAGEAATVAGWLAARRVEHHILVWQGDKPASGIQAAAREARHDLLGQWCRDHGVLHLLYAHHRGDQAETVLQRLGRGSGVDGLSAMAPVAATRWGRRLRPLLEIAPDRLRATLVAAGQEWVEDPSNRNPHFGRVRLRALMPDLAAEGLGEARLAATAGRMARARAALERGVAEATARWVEMFPAGYALADTEAFARLPEEVGLRLLARLLLAVGGDVHPPRFARLAALHGALGQGARTLAGCRIEEWRGRLLVCREAGRVTSSVALVPGQDFIWDGRFRGRAPDDLPPGHSLGALGVQGWGRVSHALGRGRRPLVPAAARPTLPAVYGEDGISVVPHLGYNRVAAFRNAAGWIVASPAIPLTSEGRRLVRGGDGIIC